MHTVTRTIFPVFAMKVMHVHVGLQTAWITRRQQHSISNLIREVYCQD